MDDDSLKASDSPIRKSSVIMSPTDVPLLTLDELEAKRIRDFRIAQERERRTIEQGDLRKEQEEKEKRDQKRDKDDLRTTQEDNLRKHQEEELRKSMEEKKKKEKVRKEPDTQDDEVELPDYGGGSPSPAPSPKKQKTDTATQKPPPKDPLDTLEVQARKKLPGKKPSKEVKKHTKEKPKAGGRVRSPTRGDRRKEPDEISFSSEDDENDAEMRERERIKRLTKELRADTAGRTRFSSFRREEFADAATMLVQAGYYMVDDIRLMQENARQFFLTDLRKSNHNRKTIKDLRLILNLFQLYEIQKDENKPTYEEITIPEKLKGWNPRFSDLRGLFLPDQDACNFFSFELAKGRCKKPPMIPFVVGDMSLKPWMPNESAHARAMEGWINLQASHKRPSGTAVSFQAWIAYSLRFILAGDLTSAWKTFGGLAAQLTHLGTVLNIATLENATIAMTYDTKVRFYANELSKTREKDKEIVALLMGEDQRLKREALRDCGFTQTFAHVPGNENKRSNDKGKNRDKRQTKGKRQKGKGKRSKSRKNEGKRPSNDWSNSWSYGKRNDWSQPTDTSEGSADKTKPADDKTSGEDTRNPRKKK